VRDAIPANRYFSREAMLRETERLWPRVWLIDGRVDAPETVCGDGVEWAGFVWRNASNDAPALAEYLGPVAALVEAYCIDDWQLDAHLTTELACNWKTSVDVHNEGYHVSALHPEVMSLVDDVNDEIGLLGDHSRIVVPSLAVQQLYIFPNLQLNMYADHALVFRHRPHHDDPERCFFDQMSLKRPNGARKPAPRARLVAPDDDAFGPVTGADLALLPRLQRGLASRGFRGGVLSRREQCIANMHDSLDRWLG
jgi:hypothetical protein